MSEGPGPRIVVSKDGPYIVYGGPPLMEQTIIPCETGGSSEWEEGETFETKPIYVLCRCGHSGNAPFCDNSHLITGFDGTETASHASFDDQKTSFEGPDLIMDDVRAFCAVARFCDAVKDSWDTVGESDDPAANERLRHQVFRCASGRLVLRDKVTGTVIEPDLPQSIGVTEDPPEACSGPLWVRGGIPLIAADGQPYEVRNRMTLCRCGQSKNKPFCDSTHIDVRYQDGRPKPATQLS